MVDKIIFLPGYDTRYCQDVRFQQIGLIFIHYRDEGGVSRAVIADTGGPFGMVAVLSGYYIKTLLLTSKRNPYVK